MLSRLAFRNAQALSVAVRGIQTSTPTSSEYQRPKRLIEPSPVRHGFIPDEWFTFFYSKTGATGPYVFLATLSTYLLSKEYYVLEHEFYNGLSVLMIVIIGVKKFGPGVAKYLDKKVDEYEANLSDGRAAQLQAHEDNIKNIECEKWRLDAQKMIYDIRKQNILMQLEATYRERLNQVYTEVKKRLDYNSQLDMVERRIAQKHMAQWIINSVLKSITPEQEKANLQQCIKNLEALAVKA
ncbi:PREDICTED: ATP synthase subunit b, mitochondrial [Dufourea novaeangliae]|uniref:ATP synthase subunit b n=1 Tax=Dufourea novaeangliae TaxID=178035 RepID=A0A154PFG9_DUFNO|nr:PREDICTED: ATP synthase subunit b, mitochondrial [Dufourea novaeangliae]KZC09980.1 ATP synthase subunit b, mitochondrial [Dufourea novaeangliae]